MIKCTVGLMGIRYFNFKWSFRKESDRIGLYAIFTWLFIAVEKRFKK